MPIAPGTRLGPYEILAVLGVGGMGEVYKARDTRLDRLVAVKTMRADLAGSGEVRDRFEREARAISKLSHPHICALFDVGHERLRPARDPASTDLDGTEVQYLVMELLDGETLAHRVAKGPLPMANVLGAGVEIAGALAEAHRRGIVHRDLKPGNVMMTRSGVKLLDFGLAKAIAPLMHGGETDDVATATGVAPFGAAQGEPLTAKGTWLGTAPYMAPEQIQGQPVDARSDVFALGAVLYEMATGRRAFPGRTPAEIATSVLHEDPAAISSAQTPVPPAFDRLVRECLAKDPDQRWQAAHDVALQLAAIGAHAKQPPDQAADPNSVRPTYRSALIGRTRAGRLGRVVAAAAIVVALLGAWRVGRGQAPGPEPIELQLLPPANGAFSYSYDTVTFALSPDGTELAFIGADAGAQGRVWMRSVQSTVARPIAGTESASSMFWSPDGKSIAFFANGALKRLDLTSNVAVQVCTVQKALGFSGTWNQDGRILYASVAGDAIYGVSTAGGTATAEVKPERSRGEARVLFPSFLPDGRRFLYLVKMSDGAGWLMVGEAGQPPRRLMPVESNVAYVDPGALVFAKGGTIVGQAFDRFTANVTGEPFAIAESVRFFLTTGAAAFSASRSGTLVYQSQRNRARLAWLDRAGHELRAAGTPGDYLNVRITPSGRTALLSRAVPATGTFDVWSLDLERGSDTRLTLDDAQTEFNGVMPPDGQTLIFSAPQGRAPRLMRKQLGTGREEALLPGEQFQVAEDISSDGRLLAYRENSAGGGFNLWTMALSGPPTPSILRRSDFNESGLRFSPDGRDFTFVSTLSRRSEVYVSPLSGGHETLVSTGGAMMARWSRDGHEIFYLSTDLRLMAVPVVRTAKAVQLGTPVTLFALGSKPWVDFDVSLDGKTFLALIPEIIADEQPLTARLHWSGTIRR